ncbi:MULTISPECIES: helix-turn-helix domain-containing protein [unclassified Fusibacter]|uniref:helix-turn-helix domain-containing protein n=1 Tax=unclassified Fusibacter TaxID=2624464 RepID=UPI0013E93A83|nr:MULTISPECIES: helix-turn-helix domain-containing protein [unclassified Fusibacter]MCK8059167.1 helix-turn-helix domain-containing protein [Fusibacter sp. A2]NPE22576.1 helix-turn-helix domain-containing protein [Fusibacter sp. A1]
MNFIEYGDLVLSIRKNCGFTREQVREVTGISIETLRRIECGKPEPKLSTLDKLSFLYKVDLIELLTKTRIPLDFFSEDLIDEIINKMTNMEYEELKVMIQKIIENMLCDKSTTPTEKKFFNDFLNSITLVEISETKNLTKNIITLENILIGLSSNRKTMLSDQYFYTIELITAIALMIQYRRNNQNTKAIRIIQQLLYKTKQYPYLNKRQINFLGSLYLNLSYSYHIMDEHDEVIHVVDEVLLDKKLAFTTTLLCDLLTRKAIALYHLGDDSYYDILTSAIIIAPPTRSRFIKSMIKSQYNITHHLCDAD